MKKSCDITFKLKAIETAEKTLKKAAACEYNVDPKRVHEWCSKKAKLVAMKTQSKCKHRRLDGGGTKAVDGVMEEALLSWIQDLRGHHLFFSYFITICWYCV